LNGPFGLTPDLGKGRSGEGEQVREKERERERESERERGREGGGKKFLHITYCTCRYHIPFVL